MTRQSRRGTRQVAAYVDPLIHTALKEIAKEEDRSLSQIVKRALLREIALHEDTKAAA